MAKSAPETILLKGEPPIREADCGEAFKPGHCVAVKADGDVDLAETDQRDVLVAKEDDLQGNGIDDVYVVGQRAFFYAPSPGDVLYVRVAAGAAAIANQAPLGIQNNGTVLTEATASAMRFIAEEALDNSGSGTEALIRARVLN